MHTASANVYCELKEQDKVVAAAAAAAGTPRETKEDLIVEREEYDPASFPRKDRRGEGLDAAWPGCYSAFKDKGELCRTDDLSNGGDHGDWPCL